MNVEGGRECFAHLFSIFGSARHECALFRNQGIPLFPRVKAVVD